MKRNCTRGVRGVVSRVLMAGVVVQLAGCGDDAVPVAAPSADLTDLVTSAGTLSPIFLPGATFYTVDVASDVASLTVTPTASDDSATITVDGIAVVSGAESGAIDLDPGVNFIFITTTATDGVTQKLYTVAVTRAEADAELADLTISAGSLSPLFSPEGTFYIVDGTLASTTTVTPTALDSGATITVNGEAVASGTTSSAMDLDMGMNTITVLVTATDGVTQIGYALLIFRGGQRAYLKASNSDTDDVFSYSVAIDNDTIVVGAPYEDSNATGIDGNQADNSADATGAAYVFVRTGGIWSHQAYLKASNPDPLDIFGCSVAVSGDTVVVGASGEDSNTTGVDGNQTDNSLSGAGAVYVFTRTGSIWSQQAYIKASNPDGGDRFGRRADLDGDTIVVGSHYEDSNGNETDNSAQSAGAAYVFIRTGGTWSQQAYLKASNTGAWDYFGYSVAVSGDTVVVGAPYESSNATGVDGDQNDNSLGSSGAAYIFTRTGGVWSQHAYLKASNSDIGDLFSYSVAIDNDTIVVGAPYEDSNATGIDGNQADNSAADSGAAYVFTYTGSNWSQQAYLKASNTDVDDQLGRTVAVDGDTAVLGTYFEDGGATGVGGDQADESAIDAGAAYVFKRSGSVWSWQAYLKASNTNAGDSFSYSVAIDNDTIVVGAPYEDSNATGIDGNQADNSAADSGAVYVFE